MKIGLVINPWAGIGGTVALKGSDGPAIRAEAIKRGAQPKSVEKARIAMTAYRENKHSGLVPEWYAAPGDMGEAVLDFCDVSMRTVMPIQLPAQTESSDTKSVLSWLLEQQVDLIIFAGGDGTARDVFDVVGDKIPVLGVPAGVKIHSSVFAVTPYAAGEVLANLIDGRMTSLRLEEVRDIDEKAFRNNRVKTVFYGEMVVPAAGDYIQHVKVGGIENDALVLNDIVDWLDQEMDATVCYFIGSGQTTATLMNHWNCFNTLLGVDAIRDGQLIRSDCTEVDLLDLLSRYSCKAILSIIGGQGHIVGRGNAQFTPAVLRALGKENVWILGSRSKLKSLSGRPLYIDSSSPELDREWAGIISVITGYDDVMIYPLVAL